MNAFRPIDTAPKGGGAELVSDPAYIEPPKILLLFADDVISVGYWDAYYAEGGRGYEGGLAWIEPVSGERLDLNFDAPIGWMPLPEQGMEAIHLISAEDVQSAGQAMLNTADTMQTGITSLAGVAEQHRRWMDDWLARFEAAIEKANRTKETP